MNSISSNFNLKLNKADVYSIEEHLLNCDHLFEPQLSSYVNINEYSLKLYKFATNFEAWHQSSLIGLVSVYFNDFTNRVAYISNVSVEKESQKKGIASSLLYWVLDYSIIIHFTSIRLEVYYTNIKALMLYDKLGFNRLDFQNQKITMIKYL